MSDDCCALDGADCASERASDCCTDADSVLVVRRRASPCCPGGACYPGCC